MAVSQKGLQKCLLEYGNMKDHIPEGDQWLVRMMPDDKIALDQLKQELHAKSYRDVVVTAINNMKPANRLYLRPFGDIADDLPGLPHLIMELYTLKAELSEKGFIEEMREINLHVTHVRQQYKRYLHGQEGSPETPETEDNDRFVE